MNKKTASRLIASVLCANMFLMNLPLKVFSSEISGFEQTSGTFNIEAAKVSGSTGFRYYDKFNLSQGDIANLVYKNNYSKFVNLVNNQITIDGLVQTMKDGSFYNGHAIFVSPNGMLVGASGVLNVGSLSVLTPSSGKFSSFKDAYEADSLSSYQYDGDKYKELITDSQGNIIINGRIMAKEEVNLYGSDIKIGDGSNRAGIIAGNDNPTYYVSQDAARVAFDSLVSNNITNTTGFNLSDGKVQIVASKQSKFADAAGNIKANIDIKKADIGADEVEISSTAEVERQERIELAEAKVNIDDSNIKGNTVSVTAKATQKKKFDSANPLEDATFIINALMDIFGGSTPQINSLWGVAGKADADITIKNSEITALKAQPDKIGTEDNPQKDLSVYIHSEASSETSENANFLTPTILSFMADEDAKIGEYFSDGLFTGFEGARSSATVNVEKSTIKAVGDNSKNIEISTEASANLDANNRLLSFVLPIGLYGVGTETISKAIVKGSTLEAKNGDINLNAISTNENAINITNDSIVKALVEDRQIYMIENNNVKTDTQASILAADDGTKSIVETNNLTVLATNLSKSEAEIGMAVASNKSVPPGGTEERGNSGISLIGLLNRSDKNVKATIEDSEIKTEEDTVVIAQNVSQTKNTAEAEAVDDQIPTNETKDKPVVDWIKDKSDNWLSGNLFDRIFSGADATAVPEKAPFLEAGGAAIWSNTNNVTNAQIKNSTVQANNVNVEADTIDLLANKASSTVKGSGSFGVGLAVIYNDEKNTTNANIDNSTVTANNVSVNALTEMPMNWGNLTFGLNLPFKVAGYEKIQFGGQFASEANGKWDLSFVYPKPKKEEGESDFEITGLVEQNIEDTYDSLKPKFRLQGFFNNYAFTQLKNNSSNAAISGSAIYNAVTNNTTAEITNGSDITIKPAENGNSEGNLVVDAVNSVLGYNAAGMIDFLIKQINYKIPGQADKKYEPQVAAGTFGLGANVIWDNYTNNATAKIDNSKVNAEKGSVDVNSVNEQSYITITMTGGKSDKFGIDGSVNVQKLNGTTLAEVSNIQDDNSINAKNVEIYAGKANIKTTGGSLNRDEDSHLIKWKEHNKEAQGDEKYIREAKDTISNIIAQGAWTSQYQEIDNTVQTSSAGVAVGASFNYTDVDRTVKAVVDNAIIEATDSVTVNADTYNQKIDAEVAAAFSGGVKQKSAGVNAQNAANNAQDPQDANDENIFGNLFDHEDEYMRNPVGNALAAVQNQFNMSIAGAVDITNDATKVESSVINNSTVKTGNKLDVTANRESKNITFGGSLGKSKKVGAGAAVNYFKQDGSVKSFIDGSTITFSGNNPELNITANNKNWILDIAVGAGVASNTEAQDKGFRAAIGGSAAVNTLKPTIEAYINNSTVKDAENKTGKINTKLEAKSDIDIIDIAGGGSYTGGSTSGISAGAALNYNNVKNTISTYIKNSTLSDIGKLTMLSDADNNFNSFAIAGAIVTGSEGGFNFNFAGSADVDYIHDTISSKIINSTITASDDVEVKANSKSENFVVAGTIDFTTAQSGAGVNGDVAVNVFRNDITSEIDKDSKILKAKDVKVSATSTEKSNVIPVGAAVATGMSYLMLAANAGVNIIDNSVKAYASGHIGSGENSEKIHSLTVAAYDETTLYSRGGTIALASADSIANLAASINVDKIDKTVEAKIKDADVKATSDVTAIASSINSLGGTKNSEGGYTREDVTTDAYKESMLKKNNKGEYDDLNLDNSFQNWNMFYNISAGATLSGSGAGVGKVIENTVTAEVNNSEIEADKLYVLSKDYSVKNIIAGSVSASGTAAAGLQVLYTRDNSTTNALITNGSKLTIANDLEILASNRKDSYEIMVAGSGAGTGVVNANIVINNITDKATTKIDNGNTTEKEIKAGKITIASDEDINSSHIVVAAGGGANLALSVAPLVNNYNMTTESLVANAKIKDAAMDMDAQSKLNTLDISVGVAGVGQGLAGVGVAIKNNYTNTVKSYIDKAVIDTTKAIDIDANSVIKSNNWLASLSIAGQGVSIVTNVLLNNVISTLDAGIKDSTIENAGAITINTNKDKKDDIKNKAIGLGTVGQGASALVNVVQNIYKNTVNSYVDNTSSTTIDSLTVNSNSDRKLENINCGISVTGMGASLLANALVNQIDSSTSSVIDVKGKTLNVTNALNLDAKDNTEAYNTMAMVNGAGAGAAAGANINLYYANNLAKAEVKSSESGQINAGSSNIHSAVVNGLENQNTGFSIGGFGAIAGDVAVIKLGKRTSTYSSDEKNTQIKDAVDYTKDKYDKITANDADNVKNLYTPTSSPSDIQTGAVATVNGNLKTTNDTTIKAESKLKGLGDKEKLTLSNVNVSAGLGVVGVAVKSTQLANNTLAEISGGKVESQNGKVSVNAESKSDVEIKNTKVDVSGLEISLTLSGGGAMYNNTSETVAQIKDATVNSAGDIDVISKSTSKSSLDSTNVVITGGGIVGVDLAEATDTNKSVALISGNTNIDSNGKLNVHSTVDTDLSSVKSTVTVAGASFVSVSKNEVKANTIGRALIENVNGTIKTNGLDIITDYNKMSAYSKANVTSVKLGDVYSGDSSGAFMNANFKSGIDSASGLIINNSGTTNITTAKDNGTDGIVAKGEIHNVHVSLQGFVANTSANAENTATSATILKAQEHKANNLNINSYLNSKAVSNAGSTKVTVGIGVNAVSVDAKDTSTMTMDIAGTNNITQNAIINATHVSNVDSDMSAFNFGGLVGGGQRVRINTKLTANTTGNLGGNFNANSTSINFDTTRNSVLSKSSGSGAGIVNVGDTKAVGELKGSSVLTVDGINTDSDTANNRLSVKNTSTSTFDVKSSDGAGGIISISSNDTTNTMSTSSTTNINNSNINSKNKVEFEVTNKAIVKDSASMHAGGVVAVADTESNNTYTSNAKLSLNNTTINAENVNLKSSSDVRTAKVEDGGIVDYVGGAGGFVAENEMKLTNTINQTSEIEINNSKLNATKDIVLNAVTSSMFKQRTANNVGGFVAIPRSKNWLTVTNNNKVSLDATSKLLAGDELEINFNSDNTLEARATSEAHHFGFKDPVAESYLTLTVNNTLQNNGSIEAGNLADINFMTGSTNNLTQYAYSEAHAAIPTTTEDGLLKKDIKNTLNVETNADITSGKDIEISYSAGKGTNSSKIAYKSICYALFGIPISKSGSKENKSINHTPSLKDDGKIVAGQGNGKYMKINRDGSIDKDTLKGFYDDDYTLYNGQQIDGQKVKEQNLASITLEIENVDESIGEVTQTISDLNAKIIELNTEKNYIQEALDEITGMLSTHELKTEADVNTMMQNDLKAIVVGENANQISESLFNTISSAYSTEVAAIETYNESHPDAPKARLTIAEFINDPNHNYNLSDDQKSNIVNAYNSVSGNFTVTQKGEFTVYKNQYIIVRNPSGSGTSQTCAEIDLLNDYITVLEEYTQPYLNNIAENQANLVVLTSDKASLQSEYDKVAAIDPSEYEKDNSEYSVVFNDINPKQAKINVSGAINPNISGSGIFSVASSGFKIDNYSTRTLLFGDLNIDSGTNNGLIINGKNHSEFADKAQAVSGFDAFNYINNIPGHKSFANLPTNGVHYKSGGDSISGITVNNYYDVNHPFASDFDIPNPTKLPSIYFLGDISTGANFNVWNESGDIAIANYILNYNKMSLLAPNNMISLLLGGNTTTPFTLKADDYIFARDGVSIVAGRDIDIKGTIKTGYSNRSITITDSMIAPENLILDVTSGETNMINLGGTNISAYLNNVNNIKAIYKDGQIYLYNIPEISVNNGVSLMSEHQVSITGNGNITVADGYQNITINNQTSSPLNVNDISNTKFSGIISDELKNAYPDKITKNTVDNATTNITSTGKLVLNGIIKNNVDPGALYEFSDGGTLNVTANNGLEVKKKTKFVDNVQTVVDSIYAGGLVDITVNGGDTLISGDITDKGNLQIYNYGDGKIDINGNLTDKAGNIDIQNDGAGKLTVNGEIVDLNGDISILGTGTGVTELTNAIYSELGDVFIVSKGLTSTEDFSVTAKKGDVSVTNNAGSLDLNGMIIAQEGDISIQNNGTSASIAGSLTDEKGDLTIINTSGDMTISSEIHHNYVNQNSAGMITIVNNPAGGQLTINYPILTWGIGKTETDPITSEESTTAILIDNRSTAKGMTLDKAVTARVGDIIINNAVKDLSVSGMVSNSETGNITIENSGDNTTITEAIITKTGDISVTNWYKSLSIKGEITAAEKGNITITNNSAVNTESTLIGDTIFTKEGDITITNRDVASLTINGDMTDNKGNIGIYSQGKTVITSAITDNEGQIDLYSVGLDTTEDSVITDKKGNIIISNSQYNHGDFHRDSMDLQGIINAFDGSVSIVNKGTGATVGGYITEEKGTINIENHYGDMTVSADITKDYINQTAGGTINFMNRYDAGAFSITGNTVNWGVGRDMSPGTEAILVFNDAANSDGVSISGGLSARLGDINIENKYSKLTTTSTAGISNTENGAINIKSTGAEGADIRGTILATEGNIAISNTKKDLLINADITEKKGNINITNSGKDLTYLGDTLNKFGDTRVINNGTGIVQVGASIDNTGNTTIRNINGENLVFSGEIYNYGNTLITNNEGLVHIYGDITNEHGSTLIQNEGVFTEITSKINNDTGSVGISNRDGHLRITDTAEINNTSNNENSNITIVNYGDDSTEPSQLIIAGNINSYNKGYVEIINNGDEATISGNIFAKDGSIGVTNSEAGKLTMSGDVIDYNGDITIFNNSDDGAEIGGTITDERGDIKIGNNGGDLKITSAITHNYVNRDAHGLISITNAPGAGKVEINAPITTDGAGKLVNDEVTAIVINNRSTAYGMTINNTVSARLGDIIIKNASDDLLTSGLISNYEQGSISITNGTVELPNNGKDLTNTATIQVKSGDAIITNNGTGKAQIGGSVTNENGNTTITNKGTNLVYSGTISNTGGNTTLTNANGVAHIYGDITNKGGDIYITNNGSFTEITKAITNDTLADSESITSGSIHISNSNGNMNITNTASISNTSSYETESITIANAGDNLTINGTVKSLNKGDIEITNTGSGIATLNNEISAVAGNIDINNSNTGKLYTTTNSDIKTGSGNIEITNNSVDGSDIRGAITGEKGDITITNNKGNLDITSVITQNYINGTSNGMISIINGENAGAVDINTTITNWGAGKTDTSGNTVAILIDNNSTTGGMSVKNAISARVGDIIINNTTSNLLVSGNVSNTEKGDITVTNAGVDLTNTAIITNKKGDITLTNNGTGKAQIGGSITNENGNTAVANNGTNLIYSGTISNTGGNTTLTNANGVAHIYGDITNKGGDIYITNNGSFTEITKAITNDTLADSESITSGSIHISNSNGNMNITNTASISNTSSYETESITIANAGDNLTINGTVKSLNKGDIEITNSGTGATTITNVISAVTGDIDIQNSNTGALTISGNITDNKGDITINNTATDEGTSLSGQISAGEGNIKIDNTSDKLTVSGSITDNNGNIDITNNGANGTEFTSTSTVTNVQGDTTIINNAGDLTVANGAEITNTTSGNIKTENKDGKFSIAGLLKHFGLGNVTVTNTGYDELEIATTGVVEATSGNIDIQNSNDGALKIAGAVTDNKGNISVTNSSSDGAEITGTVSDKEGNITVSNSAGALELGSTGKITDDKGDISISNTAANKGTTLAGEVLAKEGNITVGNTGDKLSVSGSVTNNNGKIDITNNGANGAEFTSTALVTDVKGNTTITNNAGDLTVANGAEIKNTESGDIKAENNGGKFTISGLIKHIGDAVGNIFVKNTGNKELEIASTGNIETSNGNIDIQNSNTGALDIAGNIADKNGNIAISNSDAGGINLTGNVLSDKGNTTVTNTSNDGINIATSGVIHNSDGNISVSNTGTAGIDVLGSVKSDKQNIAINNTNSDLRIGEYATANDNYINAAIGNVVINQTNGNILNNITDPDTSKIHQNADKGNPDQAYKTLITAGNDLTIISKDGDIGSTTNTNPGFSIDAGTRDYTESLNVNVGGNVIARAINENNTDNRLVNIRAKDSGLNIKDVTSDGNVIITAADWTQADVKPTPADDSYFTGYSILNTADGKNAAVTGRNISIITSNNLGSDNKPFVYLQDTLNAPNSSVSIEAEKDIYLNGRANSVNDTKLNQLISKKGTIELVLENNASIGEITADGGLSVTQKAQNLTIYNLGMMAGGQDGTKVEFDDMLYPHDDIIISSESVEPEKSLIPKYVILKVLDAADNPNRGESNLKVYSAYVKGNNGDNAHYYPDGSRLADVTIMADNIYANSAKAPDSTVPTKANPFGYQQTGKTYTNAVFGGDGSVVYEAHGINAYGPGNELSIDVLGVDPDIISSLFSGDSSRFVYTAQESNPNVPTIFHNDSDRIPFYNVDYRTNTAVISVNDYVNTNRGVSFDTLYTNNAYINTGDINFRVEDGYVANYAELRNFDKIAVVDNDFRRLVSPADIQLFTALTGSFALSLNGTINMKTSAPTVYNNPHMLVNGYHSAWNFVNRGFKENKDLIDNTEMPYNIDKNNYDEPSKRIAMRFDTTTDSEFHSNVYIYDISTTGALIRNDKKLKRGDTLMLNFKFDDVDVNVSAKVVDIDGNRAGVEFIAIPADVANRILYRYMQRANSMKTNLTSSL